MATAMTVGVPQPGAVVPLRTDTKYDLMRGVRMSIDEIRSEVDDAWLDAKTFCDEEPDRVMRIAAGHSARLGHLRVLILRVEDEYTELKNIRVRDLEPTIQELYKQYEIASRLHTTREFEWKQENER